MLNLIFSDNYFEIPKISVQFFFVFSNFEHALKHSSLVHGKLGENAWPDWKTFADTLGDDFFNSIAKKDEAQILFTKPARKLIVAEDSKTDFKETPPPTNSYELIQGVKTVRNNAFHGSKMRPTKRDIDLMQASLFVLQEALKASQQHNELHLFHQAFFYNFPPQQ